jgi:hypothetical protein
MKTFYILKNDLLFLTFTLSLTYGSLQFWTIKMRITAQLLHSGVEFFLSQKSNGKSSHNSLHSVIDGAGGGVRTGFLSSLARLGNCAPRGAYDPSHNGSCIYPHFLCRELVVKQVMFLLPLLWSDFNSNVTSLQGIFLCISPLWYILKVSRFRPPSLLRVKIKK